MKYPRYIVVGLLVDWIPVQAAAGPDKHFGSGPNVLTEKVLFGPNVLTEKVLFGPNVLTL